MKCIVLPHIKIHNANALSSLYHWFSCYDCMAWFYHALERNLFNKAIQVNVAKCCGDKSYLIYKRIKVRRLCAFNHWHRNCRT